MLEGPENLILVLIIISIKIIVVIIMIKIVLISTKIISIILSTKQDRAIWYLRQMEAPCLDHDNIIKAPTPSKYNDVIFVLFYMMMPMFQNITMSVFQNIMSCSNGHSKKYTWDTL